MASLLQVLIKRQKQTNTMIKTRVITPATLLPVTRDEAKAHLRVEHNDEDTLIDGLVAAATDYVENHCRRYFVDTQVIMYLDRFESVITLPHGETTSVVSVKYYDVDDVLQTLSTSVYDVDSKNIPAIIVNHDGQTYPEVRKKVNAVEITYNTGAALVSDVPQAIKQAMLLLIGHWYEHRESVEISGRMPFVVPHAVSALLEPYRVMRFF